MYVIDMDPKINIYILSVQGAKKLRTGPECRATNRNMACRLGLIFYLNIFCGPSHRCVCRLQENWRSNVFVVLDVKSRALQIMTFGLTTGKCV